MKNRSAIASKAKQAVERVRRRTVGRQDVTGNGVVAIAWGQPS